MHLYSRGSSDYIFIFSNTQSHASLRQMVKLSQLEVPERIKRAIEPIKDNNEAVQNFGVHDALEMAKAILDANVTPGLHFFTLNR
jgi:methylenetetrahydrofolate reductase (NADPH)